MTNSITPNPGDEQPGNNSKANLWEGAGILALGLMVVYFLAESWRKWPDPLVDSGAQWYAYWRLSHGALLYHDVVWNYGPLSAFFDAALFKIFGPGMMVLVTANLVIYGLIVVLAYWAFRKAWGRMAAFAATAVFICVFSFSHLSQIGNYNYATPYAQESTHGMLLVLVAALVAVRWCRGCSKVNAFWLGLCGGLTVVLKPEFMLAGGVVGIAALLVRWREGKRVTAGEFALLGAGLVLPTLIFALWFLRQESAGSAFIDASRAWWMVLVDHSQLGGQQEKFTGFNNPGPNILFALKATGVAVLSLGTIWAAGWSLNRPWPRGLRAVVVVAAAALLWFLSPVGGWYHIGRCFPILVAALAVLIISRVVRRWRADGWVEEKTVLALMLVLLAGTMLARMPLFPRIYHLGFFQAALAGMVLAAAVMAELPRWTAENGWGKCVARIGGMVMLAIGCVAIAHQSHRIRADQTEPVGAGRDRFYSLARDIDETGALVNWSVEQLRSAPAQATLLVLPEGVMINYLSRRVSPVPVWSGAIPEVEYLKLMQASPPDYVVLFSRDLREFGIKRFGDPGNPGHDIMKWVVENYVLETQTGGDPFVPEGKKGVVILKRK